MKLPTILVMWSLHRTTGTSRWVCLELELSDIEDLTKSGYDSPESIAGFKEFAEIYTQYKIPQQVVAYQSFTQGELPILMQSGHFATNLERQRGYGK